MNQIRTIYSLDIPMDTRLLLHLYTNGLFPMAEDGEINIIEPEVRGIIPLDNYKPSKSLKKLMKRINYEVKLNSCFKDVISYCANRSETWISSEIIDLYTDLHYQGFAHSFEVFYDEELVGGLYGVIIGKAFFGESMFSLKPNASKIALYHLVEYLKNNDFELLDTQFSTPHLFTQGCVEISQDEYLEILKKVLA